MLNPVTCLRSLLPYGQFPLKHQAIAQAQKYNKHRTEQLTLPPILVQLPGSCNSATSFKTYVGP